MKEENKKKQQSPLTELINKKEDNKLRKKMV